VTRVRWLRPEEEILVLETMPSPVREMAKLAALTLMRQGELIALRREQVHLEQGVILLPRAKAGARPVILSGEAQKILRGQLASHESAFHDLRHHGATMALNRGFTAPIRISAVSVLRRRCVADVDKRLEMASNEPRSDGRDPDAWSIVVHPGRCRR
jgi:integrase